MNLLLLLLTTISLSYSAVPLEKISSDCKDSKCFLLWSNNVEDNFDKLALLSTDGTTLPDDGKIIQYKVLEYIEDWFAGLSKENKNSVIKISYPLTQEFILRIHKKRLESEIKKIEKRVETANDQNWIIGALTSTYILKNKALSIVDDLIWEVEKRNKLLIPNDGKITADIELSQKALSTLKAAATDNLENDTLKYLYNLALLCPTGDDDMQACYDKLLAGLVEQYDGVVRDTYIKFLKTTNTGDYKFTTTQKAFLEEAGINSDDTESEDYKSSQTKDLSYLFNKIKSQGDTDLCEPYALASLIEAEYFKENNKTVDISQYYLASIYYKQLGIINKENFSPDDFKIMEDSLRQNKFTRSLKLLLNQKLFTLSNYSENDYLNDKDIKKIEADKMYLYKKYHLYNRYITGKSPEDIGFKFIKRIIDSGHPVMVTIHSIESTWDEDWYEMMPNMESIKGHAFVVVGYGTDELDPDTLEYQPYLIIRDSQIILSFATHYKMSMAAIANRINWMATLSDVSEVTTDK